MDLSGKVRRLGTRTRRRAEDELRLHHVSQRFGGPPEFVPAEAFSSFGPASVLVPPAHVDRPERVDVGSNTQFLEGVWLSVAEPADGIEPWISIGDNGRFTRFVRIAATDAVRIGHDALMGQHLFVGDLRAAVDPDAPARPGPTVIGDSVFIGNGCSIMRGVTVGDHAYLGAGAAVMADVEPYTVVVGNPARPVRRYDPAAGEWRRVTG